MQEYGSVRSTDGGRPCRELKLLMVFHAAHRSRIPDIDAVVQPAGEKEMATCTEDD
jgi:hypothetical protein